MSTASYVIELIELNWNINSCTVFFFCFVSFSTGTHKFVTEGEHLMLTAITKEQSGSYECIASNDISSPDVRTVQVTVNCKGQAITLSGYIGHQRVGGCRVKLTLSEDSWGHNFNLKKQSYENIWLVFFCFPDPPFISKARSTGTSVGQKGILQCEASAVPRADFEWYKEDRRHVSSLSSMISTCSELFDLSITGLQTHVFCCTLWS